MSSSSLRFISYFLSVCLLISCRESLNVEEEKEKIQAQIDLITKAHFDKDATLFYAPYNEFWYDAREGQIHKVMKADVLPGTQEYLDNMEFIGMDATHKPLIEISDDGKMGSYMGAILLRGKLKGDPVFWVVSWQSVLKKIDKEWKIISNANTQATPGAGAELILEQSKKQLGVLGEESAIYAMADCKSPGGEFKTLLISNSKAGRMEQQSGEDHSILKHGPEASWTYNLKTAKLNDEVDELTKMFIRGHELHWLSFRPEDRLMYPTYKGVEDYNERTSFKIEFKDGLDRSVFFYYDFGNYRPVGFSITGNKEGEMINVYFSDWREEGDLKVFHKATFEDGPNLFEYEFSDIKFGTSGEYDLESKASYMNSAD